MFVREEKSSFSRRVGEELIVFVHQTSHVYVQRRMMLKYAVHNLLITNWKKNILQRVNENANHEWTFCKLRANEMEKWLINIIVWDMNSMSCHDRIPKVLYLFMSSKHPSTFHSRKCEIKFDVGCWVSLNI